MITLGAVPASGYGRGSPATRRTRRRRPRSSSIGSTTSPGATRRGLALSVGDRADVVQEAVTDAYRAVARDRERFRSADNPAALLETVIGRAVGVAHHRARMAGFGGLATNGRHWRAIAPQLVGGPAADQFLYDVPVQARQPTRHVPDAAARINDWVAAELGVALTSDAVHAVEYVLDRLVAGVSRRSLRRGGHSALARDPAMRHLGFTPATARLFAAWALGSEKTRTRHRRSSTPRSRTSSSIPDARSRCGARHWPVGSPSSQQRSGALPEQRCRPARTRASYEATRSPTREDR